MSFTNQQSDSGAVAPDPDLTRLRKGWAVYSHGELKQQCQQLGSTQYLVDELLPDRSLNLLVGDSGLGKSALVYQIAVCIAAGMTFLGRKVKQGRVLCLDFENGMGQVAEIIDQLCRYLGLSEAPNNLHLWNINGATTKYGKDKHKAIDIIKEVKPDLVVADSITGMYPHIEEKSQTAINCLHQFRELIRTDGTSSLALHHIKKPPSDTRFAPPALETCSNVREWFLQARGARALINGTDVRLGVDRPDIPTVHFEDDDNKAEVALVLRGFGRVRGEIPRLYLSRHFDKDDNALGYGVISGSNLLFNGPQQDALAKLPDAFRFKDAKQAYGKADQATTDFLNKCTRLGLIRKLGKQDGYEKVAV